MGEMDTMYHNRALRRVIGEDKKEIYPCLMISRVDVENQLNPERRDLVKERRVRGEENWTRLIGVSGEHVDESILLQDSSYVFIKLRWCRSDKEAVCLHSRTSQSCILSYNPFRTIFCKFVHLCNL